MVSRVASFGQQALLLSATLENQVRVATAQEQIATGRQTDEFRGLAGQTTTLLGAQSTLTRVETFQRTIDTINGTITANDVQVGGIISAFEDIQDTLRLAIANDQGAGIEQLLETNYQFIVNALNTNFNGGFLFAGANTGTQPLSSVTIGGTSFDITTLDGLQNAITAGAAEVPPLTAADVIAQAFQNSDIPFQARVADGVDIEFGLLANEIGEAGLNAIQSVIGYIQDPATLPVDQLEGPLSDTAQAFLTGILADFDAAIDAARTQQTANGLTAQRLEVIDSQHADSAVFLETFIADIQDVDIAEAITRLNNDQVALQASFQAIRSLSDLSLLDFL